MDFQDQIRSKLLPGPPAPTGDELINEEYPDDEETSPADQARVQEAIDIQNGLRDQFCNKNSGITGADAIEKSRKTRLLH